MSILKILVPPLSGAVIGYFTNWLAIKMLFRPHGEKRVFGVRLPFTPGLIPKERAALAAKLGALIKNSVLTDAVMQAYLTSAETRGKVEGIIGEMVDEDVVPKQVLGLAQTFVRDKAPALTAAIRDLSEKSPELDASLKALVAKIIKENIGTVVGMFVNYDKIYANIKNNIYEYLNDTGNQARFFDKMAESLSNVDAGSRGKVKEVLTNAAHFALDRLAPKVSAAFAFDRIIEDKVNDFSMPYAEELILSVVDRELKAITWLGGVLGFVIGWIPAIMAVIG